MCLVQGVHTISKLKTQNILVGFFLSWHMVVLWIQFLKCTAAQYSLKRGRKLQVQKLPFFMSFLHHFHILYALQRAEEEKHCPFCTENDIRLTRYDKKRRGGRCSYAMLAITIFSLQTHWGKILILVQRSISTCTR